MLDDEETDAADAADAALDECCECCECGGDGEENTIGDNDFLGGVLFLGGVFFFYLGVGLAIRYINPTTIISGNIGSILW